MGHDFAQTRNVIALAIEIGVLSKQYHGSLNPFVQADCPPADLFGDIIEDALKIVACTRQPDNRQH